MVSLLGSACRGSFRFLLQIFLVGLGNSRGGGFVLWVVSFGHGVDRRLFSFRFAGVPNDDS
jgi:hypothetical protein